MVVCLAALLDRLYRADSVATSVGLSAAASVISRLIGLARGVALAWLISQAQFGLFGVALLVVNVLLPLCSAGLYEGVTRYVPFHESAGALRKFVIRSSVLVFGVTLAVTVILGLLAQPVGSVLFSAARLATGPDMPAGENSAGGALMLVSLACVLTLALYHTLLGLLKGLRMFRAFSAAELLSAFLFAVLAVAGALRGFTTARALIAAYATACVVAVLVFTPGLLARLPRGDQPTGRESSRPTSSLLTYSAWAAGTAILWHALAYYPMWYLLKVSDSETVGTFHAVRIITQFVQIGAVLLIAVVAANVNRLWEHDGREVAEPRMRVLTKACLIALIAGASILSVLRPIVMRLFPSKFAVGAAAYDPLILFFLLVGIVGLVAVRLNVLEKPRHVCLAWLIGAVVNVAVSYLLLGPAADATTSTQVSALQSAAWAGVAGVTAALVVCIGLVRMERLALDLPSMVLVVAAFSVGFGWSVALPVLALLLVATFVTGHVFTPQERADLRVSLLGTSTR